jgi:6-phosphogluconolactonase
MEAKEQNRIIEPQVRIFSTPLALAREYAGELCVKIAEASRRSRIYTIALSGGNTPKTLFSAVADKCTGSIAWENVHLFWGDERCVPPEDARSNYGMTLLTLLRNKHVPATNVHRIRGEADPGKEAERYSATIRETVKMINGWPSFDLVMLGVGEDGHTVSIFPGQLHLMNSDRICEVTRHPVNGDERITITGKVINNASEVVFMVTGKNKAKVVCDILRRTKESESYPASFVNPVNGSLEWLLDQEASMGVAIK